MIFGPTFAEMRDPGLVDPAAAGEGRARPAPRPLDPLNLWNLSWKADGAVPFTVLPEALTGVRAPIVVLSGRHFPTGSHKVGPAYSILVEKQLDGACAPGEQTLVFPSTGNFGIGGAWVGPRMGYRSLVVLPEEMSAERFEKIRGYGAEVIATPGCESNVKEIYDKVRELRAEPANRILNQFEEFGNYRFHFHCTAAAARGGRAARSASRSGAFVSAMGSAGTIAAGEGLRRRHPGVRDRGRRARAVPDALQRRLRRPPHRGHRRQARDLDPQRVGHRTCSSASTTSSASRACSSCRRARRRSRRRASTPALARSWVGFFGVSGVCNVLAAIRAARHYGLGPAAGGGDGGDRRLRPLPVGAAAARRGAGTDGRRARPGGGSRSSASRRHRLAGSRARREARRRWHNQKYFTWVEQQGKTRRRSCAPRRTRRGGSPHQERAHEIDRRIRERRA